jgi:hypothetical protein
MTTKRRSQAESAVDHLEKLMGGPLTLGGALSALRHCRTKSATRV